MVPGAAVRVVNVETNVTTNTTSNPEGNYEVLNLNPGQYRIEAEMQGFKRYERSSVELRVGDVLKIDIPLELGAVAESVTVTEEAPVLESTNADLGQVIDNRRIQDLPLPGGSPMYLIQLTPGVISTNPPTHGWLPHATDSTSNMASSGTRTRSSEFTLDGIPNMTQGGAVSFSPPPEMLQEFRVQTTPFDASVGHFTGAYVNMVLKTGTNDLHGTGYYSFVGSPLMTRPFFTNRQIYDTSTGPVTQEKIDRYWPYTRTNRYRGTVSGPLYIPKVYDGRNKTFWTFGMDVLDRSRPEQGNFTVPTAAERTGDFSQLLSLGSKYQIYDPASIKSAGAGRFSRLPLPGNIIPASRLDPMAQKMLGFFPMPNAAGTVDGRNNYTDPQPRNIDYHSVTARVDQVINDRNRLYGSFTSSFLLETWGKAFHNDAMGQARNRIHHGFALDDVMTLRPDMVLDLRYGITRFVLHERPQSIGFDPSTLGFPTSFTNLLDSSVTTFPEIAINGYAAIGDPSGLRSATNYHTFSATATHMRGNHSLRFGGEFRILQENNYNYGAVSPHIAFDQAWTRGPMDNSPTSPIGQGLATFLLGLPTGGYVDRNPSYAEQSGYTALFLQDDWRVSPKLTINMGLRWEYELPITERYNRTNRGFDFTSPNPISAAALANYAKNPAPALPVSQFQTLGGLLFSGVDGQPRGLFNGDRNNFAPRIGIAYQISPRTVLRTGYGIFFDSIGADQDDVAQQGYSQRTNLTPSLDNGLSFHATLNNPFPDGLLAPAGSSAGLETFLGRSPSFFWPTRKAGYVQRWSFNIQHELPGRTLIEVGYVGNRGTGLGIAQDLNALPAQYLSTSPVRDQPTIDFLTQAVTNPFYGLPQFDGSGMQGRTVALSQLLKPYPEFAAINSTLSGGSSWYHSLQIRAEKRMAYGFTIQGSYTWSKFMEAISRLNDTDTRPEHVISPQDRPHHLIMSGIYELPFGRGKHFLSQGGLVNHVLGGWSVQGIYQAQSGPPIGFGNIVFYGNIQDMVKPTSDRTVEQWFNTGAGFETDPRKALGQNIRTFPSRFTGLRADGFNNFDFSVFKTFPIHERLKFQLRAEAQDAFNHAMFAAPNTAPANTLFGSVNAIVGTEQRRISIVGKLNW